MALVTCYARAICVAVVSEPMLQQAIGRGLPVICCFATARRVSRRLLLLLVTRVDSRTRAPPPTTMCAVHCNTNETIAEIVRGVRLHFTRCVGSC